MCHSFVLKTILYFIFLLLKYLVIGGGYKSLCSRFIKQIPSDIKFTHNHPRNTTGHLIISVRINNIINSVDWYRLRQFRHSEINQKSGSHHHIGEEVSNTKLSKFWIGVNVSGEEYIEMEVKMNSGCGDHEMTDEHFPQHIILHNLRVNTYLYIV